MGTTNIKHPFIAGIIGLGLAGCGGGSGRLTLRLSDAPPNTDVMSAVVITLAGAEAHVAGGGGEGKPDDKGKADAPEPGDDGARNLAGGKGSRHGGWVVVMSFPRAFDLLALQNDVTASLGSLSLPTGKITQIRLHVDPTGSNEVRLKDGRVCPLDLKNVDQTGVKITHPFKALDVEPGKDTRVTVDVDVHESVAEDGDCAYRLVPVVKIKAVELREDRGPDPDEKD